MINDFYLSHIDQLTDEERSVFLYRFVLKLSHQATAYHLNKPIKKVNSIVNNIRMDIEFMKVRKEIFEDFDLADML